MVKIIFSESFEKSFKKIKNKDLKTKIIKQLKKIKRNPSIGKPMRYDLKGTRELHIKPFRLSYSYFEEEGKVILLRVYHKDER